MNTPARVVSVRVNTRALLFGRCAYCNKRHRPGWSYWFRIYAYLKGWTR